MFKLRPDWKMLLIGVTLVTVSCSLRTSKLLFYFVHGCYIFSIFLELAICSGSFFLYFSYIFLYIFSYIFLFFHVLVFSYLIFCSIPSLFFPIIFCVDVKKNIIHTLYIFHVGLVRFGYLNVSEFLYDTKQFFYWNK